MCKEYKTAQELLNDYLPVSGGMDSLPINVEDICRFLNIEVIKVNSASDDFIGKVHRNKENKGVVTVNMFFNTYEPRLRFTIAHEIGHFCLHLRPYMDQGYVDSNEAMFRKEDVWSKDEKEANVFAAELLMPERSIKDEISRIIASYGSPDESGRQRIMLSDLMPHITLAFNVSNVAMDYRLRNLGLIK